MEGKGVLTIIALMFGPVIVCTVGPPKSASRYVLMTAILTSLYVSVIIFVGAFLFTGVDWLEPNRRFAIILKCAIVAAGGIAIVEQLLP